jgi:hypothetical protein
MDGSALHQNRGFRHLHPNGAGRSQALMEFALALPILLVIIFGIVDFALIFQAWLSVENIARQTVRYAVTGQYDPMFCPDYDADHPDDACSGDDYLADQDHARLITIREVAKQWEVAIFKTGAPNKTEKGFLRLTLCSNRDADHSGTPDFTYTRPVMGSTIYADCTPGEDAGSPGDNVYVFVDFNHPLITPFLSQVWPMIHLVSYRQGVVETFRTARSIVQPGEGLQPPDTFTPSPQPTDTPGPSSTPEPPPTETLAPTATEPPSPTVTLTTTVTPSLTPTNTPTVTRTPTATPTVDCALFDFDNTFTLGWGSGSTAGLPRVTIDLYNGDFQDTRVHQITFSWPYYDAFNPSQYLTRWRFNGSTASYTDSASSPTTTLFAQGAGPYFASGVNAAFDFDFGNDDENWPGPVPPNSFGLSVDLENGCTVSISGQTYPTATASRTPTATLTRTPTPTSTRTLTPTVTDTPSRTPTNTPVTPSNTPTLTRTATATVPSNTPTQSRTPTPVTPSNTPTQTYTATPVTPSNTPTQTATRTPVPPSPTSTRTFTPTPVPPTNTATRTNTPTPIVPTDTPSSTPTRTPIPPTTTGTRTATPVTPSHTSTPIPVYTATRTPVATWTPKNPGG